MNAEQKAAKAAKDKARRARNKAKVKADAKAKTASASKGTKKVKAAAQPEEPTRKMPGERAIVQLSNDFMRASDRASTAAGVAGKLLSDAAKKMGLNSPEFKRAHRLREVGMKDPQKLDRILSDFDYYRKCLKLDDLSEKGLFKNGEGRPEIEEELEDDTETKTEAPALAADAEEHEGVTAH